MRTKQWKVEGMIDNNGGLYRGYSSEDRARSTLPSTYYPLRWYPSFTLLLLLLEYLKLSMFH